MIIQCINNKAMTEYEDYNIGLCCCQDYQTACSAEAGHSQSSLRAAPSWPARQTPTLGSSSRRSTRLQVSSSHWSDPSRYCALIG